jgi:chromosome segregation ATPase
MKKEKESVIEVGGRAYGKSAVQSLLQRVDAMRTSGEEMGKEITSLKRQIGGFKTSNERYKHQAKNDALYAKHLQEENQKTVSDLEAQLKYARAYAKEADELRKTVEEKDRVIAGLQSQIAELNKRIANNEKNIQDLTGERDVAIANYDYVCGLPWYQRMFFKGK